MKTLLLAPIVAFFCAGAAIAAAPPLPPVQLVLDICESSTVAQAAGKGDTLGWSRMTAAQSKEWRTTFVDYNGGTVELVGWVRGPEVGGDAISFWIAKGQNPHQACSYTPADPAALRAALVAHLGAPARADENAIVTMLEWTHGRYALIFSQSGAAGSLMIANKD
jgi:hypothetical protein